MRNKETFANSKNEGGILNKNAFTLIELLAIIVILAIIAVITVPIILNIIDNSRRGAASDSAYGYKDAVNKWYVTKLSEDHDFRLSGDYSVTNGVLNGLGVNNVEIPLSGDKPSSGKLHYTNNVLDDGCLVIGDYKITFKSDGSVNETVKGNCDDYVIPVPIPTMAEMCPGCKFIYATESQLIIGENMPSSTDTTNDYTELSDHPYFLGLIESPTNPEKIGRVFACGIENGTPFCLEGNDGSKWSDDANIRVLNAVFPSCKASASEYNADCQGLDVRASAGDGWDSAVSDSRGGCYVYYGEYSLCSNM